MKSDHQKNPKARLHRPARIAIIQAGWHRAYTDLMIRALRKALEGATEEDSPSVEIEQFSVPGCYEIPLAAKKLAATSCYDALVIFGVIIRGETDHYQVILDTCIRELGKVMYDFEIPIINEILPADSIDLVKARSKGKFNKGREAAAALIEMLNFMATVPVRSE
jgi:6,7-dimethyl-8-ribityllumazine synthase